MSNNKSLEDIFAAANQDPSTEGVDDGGKNQNKGEGDGGQPGQGIETKDPEDFIDDSGQEGGDTGGQEGSSNDADEGEGQDPKDGDDDSKSQEGEPSTLGDHAEVLSSLFSAVVEQVGADVKDVPTTPEELVEKLAEIVSENSRPSFSSPISEEFDAYIRSGGTLEDFIAEYAGGLESLPSLETDEEKISVIANVLAEAGFSKEVISRKIEKYIEDDTLDDEATDALSVIVKRRNDERKKVAEARREEEIKRAKEADNFFKDVRSEISQLKDVRGIQITKAQSKELLDYCLKVDKKDGLTAYQRDYAKSPVRNFIESAFFTKYGTAMIKAAESAGSSNAVEKFKQSLKNQKISGNSPRQSNPRDEMESWIKLAGSYSGRR